MNWICVTAGTALLLTVSLASAQSAPLANPSSAAAATVKQANATRQAPLIVYFDVKAGQRSVMRNPSPSVLVLPAGKSPAPPVLKPGVYETAPYSCIVVVPGLHPDDRALIGSDSGNNYSAMPIIRPDLQFIPRSPGK
jgi:hypothetical protein